MEFMFLLLFFSQEKTWFSDVLILFISECKIFVYLLACLSPSNFYKYKAVTIKFGYVKKRKKHCSYFVLCKKDKSLYHMNFLK